MSSALRPTAVLIRRPTVTRETQTGHFVLGADTEKARWSRVLSARAARVLWDGLTTTLFGGAGEKFVHVAQTALFQPERDPTVTDWIQVTSDPSGLLVVRGLSTSAPQEQNWIARLTHADGHILWEALEPLLFSEVRGRARPAPSAPPAPAPAAASGPVTPTRRTVLVEPQVKLVCDDYPGADPPLLFVHGAFCDHTIWRYQVAHFAASHRCATLDLRGHGASDKPRGSYLAATWAADLEQVCQTLDLHAPVLVAHSLGASAALHLAAYTTRPLSGLVLIEPAAIVDDREAQLFAEFSLGPETAPDFGPRFARRVQNLLGDELAPSLADPLRRVMMATPPHVAAGLDEAMFSFSTGPVAARVTVPTLVLLAVHRSEDAHFFQRYMRRADVRVMEDVTHFPMLVTPGRTNAAIGEFLQRLAA